VECGISKETNSKLLRAAISTGPEGF